MDRLVRLFRALLPAALAGALAGCAPAGGAPAAPAEPGAWRFLGGDDSITTSRCIGRPETPLCTVETLLACFQRGRLELCRMVDDGADNYAQVFATPPDRDKALTYRVADSRTLTAAALAKPDAAADRADPAAREQPGDVLMRIEQREAKPGAPPGPATASQFLLRRRPDGRWQIVAWDDPDD